MIDTPMRVHEIGYGDAAIARTVQAMKTLIERSLGNQRVRQKAEELISAIPEGESWEEVRAIHRFVRDHVRYTKDPKGLEYVQTPDHLLRVIEQHGMAYGDCDDKTVLGLALLKNLGYDVAIKVASYTPNQRFSHVYGLVKIDGTWVPFDATKSYTELGWEAKPTTREYEVKVGSPTPHVGDIDWSSVWQSAVGGAFGSVLGFVLVTVVVAPLLGRTAKR